MAARPVTRGGAWPDGSGARWTAKVSRAQGRLERAARLLGAAEQLLETIRWTFPPGERATHDRAVAAVRDALGAEPYRTAHGEGAAMALDHAIEYAMQDEA